MWSFALRDRGLMSLGENVHKERLQFPWLETMEGAKSVCVAEEHGGGDALRENFEGQRKHWERKHRAAENIGLGELEKNIVQKIRDGELIVYNLLLLFF